jgi:hypothetical protein
VVYRDLASRNVRRVIDDLAGDGAGLHASAAGVLVMALAAGADARERPLLLGTERSAAAREALDRPLQAFISALGDARRTRKESIDSFPVSRARARLGHRFRSERVDGEMRVWVPAEHRDDAVALLRADLLARPKFDEARLRQVVGATEQAFQANRGALVRDGLLPKARSRAPSVLELLDARAARPSAA